MLRGAGLSVEIEPDCPVLCNGFHAADPGYRWTDGRGGADLADYAALFRPTF